MKNFKVNRTYILLFVASLFAAFFLGRATINEPQQEIKKIVKYEKSNYTKRDTIFMPKEREVVKWKYRDGKTVYLPSKVIYRDGKKIAALDTTKSIDDYFLTRNYDLDFSSDTIGTFKVSAEVNQNRLISARSYVRPVVKREIETRTIYRVPLIQFYTLVGTSVDFKTNQVQFGVDLKRRLLIGVSGIKMNDKYGYTINAGIKF